MKLRSIAAEEAASRKAWKGSIPASEREYPPGDAK